MSKKTTMRKASDKLIELQEEFRDCICSGEPLNANEILNILDDIIVEADRAGYLAALEYTWTMEESEDYIRYGVHDYLKIGEDKHISINKPGKDTFKIYKRDKEENHEKLLGKQAGH